jgi:hypothetical protein
MGRLRVGANKVVKYFESNVKKNSMAFISFSNSPDGGLHEE